jgi:hypothetical protein
MGDAVASWQHRWGPGAAELGGGGDQDAGRSEPRRRRLLAGLVVDLRILAVTAPRCVAAAAGDICASGCGCVRAANRDRVSLQQWL